MEQGQSPALGTSGSRGGWRQRAGSAPGPATATTTCGCSGQGQGPLVPWGHGAELGGCRRGPESCPNLLGAAGAHPSCVRRTVLLSPSPPRRCGAVGRAQSPLRARCTTPNPPRKAVPAAVGAGQGLFLLAPSWLPLQSLCFKAAPGARQPDARSRGLPGDRAPRARSSGGDVPRPHPSRDPVDWGRSGGLGGTGEGLLQLGWWWGLTPRRSPHPRMSLGWDFWQKAARKRREGAAESPASSWGRAVREGALPSP